MANREQRPNREKKKPKQPKPAPTPGKPQPGNRAQALRPMRLALMQRADGPVSASDERRWQCPLAPGYVDGRDGRMRLRLGQAGMHPFPGPSSKK
jgi:hypothetical protein